MKAIKLSDYIKSLSVVMLRHGDLDCVYAHDTEGNGFSPILFSPSVGKMVDGEFEQFDKKSKKKPTVVCVN
jgi:hypothetical protein